MKTHIVPQSFFFAYITGVTRILILSLDLLHLMLVLNTTCLFWKLFKRT